MVDINLLPGILVTTQRPLDAKTYFQTLAELADLGTNDYKAFYYYDRMRALCLEDDKTYVWRQEATAGEIGLLGTAYTYPANSINNGIDYSGKSFNFFVFDDGSEEALPLIENYGAIWISGTNDWDAWGDPYIISNVAYTAPDTIVTLPGPPTTPDFVRFDIIYGNDQQQILYRSGNEGLQATVPDIDESTEKLFQIVQWTFGSPEPVGIASIQVYNENAGEPNEWTASTTEPTIDLASSNLPSLDSTHIEGVDVPDGSLVIFLDDNSNSYGEFSGLTFDLQTPTENAFIRVSLALDGARITRYARVRPGIFGYSGANGSYQRIVISKTNLRRISRLTFINGNFVQEDNTFFNEIHFEISSYETAPLDLVRIDNVNMVTGQNGSDVYNNTYLGLLDTYDLNYRNKINWSPVVNETEDGLILKRTALLSDLYTGNAIINNGAGVEYIPPNFDYRIWGRSYIIDQIAYEGIDNYVEGIRTLSDAPLINSRFDVFVINSDTKAQGTVALNAGGSGSIDTLTINGISIITAPIPYNNTLQDTAIDLANNINSQVTTPNYFARAINGTVYIDAVEKGIIPNGYVVSCVATSITVVTTNMLGGLDNTHSVGILTGYAELNYVKPIPDPLTQVEVTSRVTSPGETAPPEIVITTIYDENLGDPSEFNIVAQSAGSNPDYLINPQNLTKSFYFPNTTGVQQSYIFYTPTNDLLFEPGAVLYFWLRTSTSWPINQIRFGVQLASNTQVSNTMWYNRNAALDVGFNHALVNTWQLVTLPMELFNLGVGNTFNEIRIYADQNPVMQLDNMYFQSGGGAPVVGISNISVQNELGVEQFVVTNQVRFEGVVFDSALKKITATPPTAFELVTEGGNDGYRLIGRNPLNFGDIGWGAVDGSYSTAASSTKGARADSSVMFGYDNTIYPSAFGAFNFGWSNVIGVTNNPSYSGVVGGTAGYLNNVDHYSNYCFGTQIKLYGDSIGGAGYSFATGRNHDLDIVGGFAAGLALAGQGVGCFILGQANVDFSTSTNTGNIAGKLIGVIGNGTLNNGPLTANVRKNHSEFYYDGEYVLPSVSIAMIDNWANGKIVPTREWCNSKFVSGAVGSATGSALLLDNILGTLYNQDSGDTKNYTAYTISGSPVVGGRAMARINAPSQPTISGANLEQGFDFIPNTDMYLNVWSPDGVEIRYFFSPAAQVQFVNRQIEYTTNVNKNCVASDAGYLFLLNTANPRSYIVDDQLPQNGEVEFLNISSQNWTFTQGAGAVLNTPDGVTLIPGAACTLIKRGGTNEYWLKGELQ